MVADCKIKRFFYRMKAIARRRRLALLPSREHITRFFQNLLPGNVRRYKSPILQKRSVALDTELASNKSVGRFEYAAREVVIEPPLGRSGKYIIICQT